MRTFYIFKMTYLGCTWDMGWSLKQIQSEDNTKTQHKMFKIFIEETFEFDEKIYCFPD